MRISKYLIAGGNPTALVSDCPDDERFSVSNSLLAEVEQVGYVNTRDALAALMMMGGELCVNATLALAAQLSAEGQLYTSGLSTKVNFRNENGLTSIEFPMSYKRSGKVVLLPGIGFECTAESFTPDKSRFIEQCNQYSLPAFGVIQYEENRITPYVYVKETDSLVKETACGSGSIAVSLVVGRSDIVQPTGKTIKVERSYGTFKVTSGVEQI
jgi:hypothetical protein